MTLAILLLLATTVPQVPGPTPEATPSPVVATQKATPAPPPETPPTPEALPAPTPSPTPTAAPRGAARAPVSPPPPPTAAIRVGQLTFVENLVERGDGNVFEPVKEGDLIRTGDRIRVGPEGMARLEFPWMAVGASPNTTLFIPKAFLLSTILESGRIELTADAAEIIKLKTAEAEVRGKGRIVIRRQNAMTLIGALTGSARVRGARKTVTLKAGQGTIVRAGQAPRDPSPLPAPPESVAPGSDPLYVRKGKPVALSWAAGAPAFHVQLLALGSSQVLMERETTAPALALEIPWPGTFRWRVASHDEQGIESAPSAEGWICVYDW